MGHTDFLLQTDEEHPDIKRAKSNGSESAARPSQDASALANAAPGTGAPMTADQIRAMMSNARKEIQARKNALSNLKGNKVEPVAPASQPTPASLPPPGIAIPGKSRVCSTAGTDLHLFWHLFMTSQPPVDHHGPSGLS